jgi:putative DNA primase/helicase
VAYNPQAPMPEIWLNFVGQLLHEEDILTLQEFMGYCLIPSTAAQKMLLITGKGGEGKSRIGVVMKALLGSNMNLGSIAKVEKSPFARADLQHQLLMVDDDLKLEALDQTNYLKSIITAELPMDLERKGVQSYQGQLFVRFLAFGNGTLQALHDRSYGFFRRQILLETKERPRDRKDDPYLGVALQQEAEGILLWCIEGLKRLLLNDMRFTQSKRARENLLRSMAQSNNITEFLRSEGYIRFDPAAQTSSRALYEVYKDWCLDNAYVPLRPNTFWGFLNQNLETYRLSVSRTVPIGNDKYARGYLGIALRSRF